MYSLVCIISFFWLWYRILTDESLICVYCVLWQKRRFQPTQYQHLSPSFFGCVDSNMVLLSTSNWHSFKIWLFIKLRMFLEQEMSYNNHQKSNKNTISLIRKYQINNMWTVSRKDLKQYNSLFFFIIRLNLIWLRIYDVIVWSDDLKFL